MKIIITGATGFIGVHLSDYLCKKDYFIEKVSLRRQNYTINSSADALINLVGKAHDREASEKDFYYANVELLKDLFQKFKNSNIKTFIHISSILAVEEISSEKPLGEDKNCNPISNSGRSKREFEKWLLEQTKFLSEDKKIIILRPPMIHGEGNKGNLNLLYKVVSKGIPWPLASFENERSFLSIDNLNYLINEMINNQEISSGIYHLADDETISTNQLIKIIANTSGKNAHLWKIPINLIKFVAKIGDKLRLPLNSERLQKLTENYVVSNKKIKTVLGIKKLPLTAEEGLIKTIKSFKE